MFVRLLYKLLHYEMRRGVVNMRTHQNGSTLIIVLGLLVVITLIGTLAMKNSLVSLNIATNSQAQQIMTQSSDSAFFSLEDPTQLGRHIMGNGVLGYLKGDANKERELVFCMRSDDVRFFDLAKASLIYWPSGAAGPKNNDIGTNGYCNMTTANHYTTGRRAVMTQVAVRYTSTPTKPFEFYQRGTDGQTAKLEQAERIMVHSTSLMPTLANGATNTQINTCLSAHLNLASEPVDASFDATKPEQVTANTNGKVSVSQCLTALGVPHTTQVVEYKLQQN